VLGAYDAFRAGDPDRFERHARALAGHTLEPWVEYWRLKLRIEDAAAVQIEPFLARHAHTYLGDLLRGDWVKELARREDWHAFERALGPLVEDDLEIRCHAWRARLARDDAQVAIEARAVWLELRELPEGCQKLVGALLARGAVDEERVWQRARQQLYYGYVTAARRTLEDLPAAQRPDERLLGQAVAASRSCASRSRATSAPSCTRHGWAAKRASTPSSSQAWTTRPSSTRWRTRSPSPPRTSRACSRPTRFRSATRDCRARSPSNARRWRPAAGPRAGVSTE
jgi:soluble lytic murein transglycosylase